MDADGDGCGTRREVLIAEAVTAPAVGSGCGLSGGSWYSPYDGGTEAGTGRGFDIDHMVPLAEAWDSGAADWGPARREDFANDLGYPDSLVAVSAGSNRSKGDRDPAQWQPPDAAARCWCASAWVQVKTRWGLSADQREAAALRDALTGCDPAPAAASAPAPATSAAAAGDDGEESENPAEAPPETTEAPTWTRRWQSCGQSDAETGTPTTAPSLRKPPTGTTEAAETATTTECPASRPPSGRYSGPSGGSMPNGYISPEGSL